MKPCFVFIVILAALAPLHAKPLYSTAWGFRLDLPEGYEFTEGDGKDRFSFAGPDDARFDIRVYDGVYTDIKAMAEDIGRRLRNQGETDFFTYRDKKAALLELRFSGSSGWGICMELGTPEAGTKRPLLLALSYAPEGSKDIDLYHMSALDSLVPSEAERHYPGPIMEYGFPRGEAKKTVLAETGLSAQIRENDAEAAQTLVDREFALLRRYQVSENWQEAWIRFYRVVYRDSWDRIAGALFQLERSWNVAAPAANAGSERAFAEKALAFVQDFKYERDLIGSDFVNLVSAVIEGRGDCDSRAMLWAMILAQADIPAAMMVSREYSHAMGLADIPGTGARFQAGGTEWLVAETTAKVDLGLIGKNVSDTTAWLGIMFN
jgi:hypothetical protein